MEPSLNNLGDIISNIGLDDLGNPVYNVTLTESEISALVNEGEPSMPVKDIQVRINDDGIIESSGMLDIGNISLPVYIKTKGEIVSNKADFSINDLRVGSIPMPASIRNLGVDVINSSINNQIKNEAGVGPSMVTFSDGEMHLSLSRN